MQGFGLPQWIQGAGVGPCVCMLGMSAGTLFMAVGWIQIIAGELVGCLQVRTAPLTPAVCLHMRTTDMDVCCSLCFHLKAMFWPWRHCSLFSHRLGSEAKR